MNSYIWWKRTLSSFNYMKDCMCCIDRVSQEKWCSSNTDKTLPCLSTHKDRCTIWVQRWGITTDAMPLPAHIISWFVGHTLNGNQFLQSGSPGSFPGVAVAQLSSSLEPASWPEVPWYHPRPHCLQPLNLPQSLQLPHLLPWGKTKAQTKEKKKLWVMEVNGSTLFL